MTNQNPQSQFWTIIWESIFLLVFVWVMYKHLNWLQTWLPYNNELFLLVLAGIVALIYKNFRPMLLEHILIYQMLIVGVIAVGYLPDVFAWLYDDVGLGFKRPWYLNKLPLPVLGMLGASLLRRLGRWMESL
jgi:hypothetical protein